MAQFELRTSCIANRSENELQRVLHDACRMTSGSSQEARIRDGDIDRVELMVIEDVESLPTKLKCFRFAYEKTLEQGHVEVCPEWIVQTVAARIAERQPSWD